jgi:hypothetical protein
LILSLPLTNFLKHYYQGLLYTFTNQQWSMVGGGLPIDRCAGQVKPSRHSIPILTLPFVSINYNQSIGYYYIMKRSPPIEEGKTGKKQGQ